MSAPIQGQTMGSADASLFLGPVSTIIVGADERKYLVHKELLRTKLGYFRSAYRTNMRVVAEDTFRIDDVPDLAFRCLVAWLYTGNIFLDSVQNIAFVNVDESTPKSPCGEKKFAPLPDSELYLEDDVDSDSDVGTDFEDRDDDILAARLVPKGFYEPWSEGPFQFWMFGLDPMPKNDWFVLDARAMEHLADVEKRLVNIYFPGYEASALDAYQLGVLIRHYSEATDSTLIRCVAHWRETQSRLVPSDGEVCAVQDLEQNIDAFDCLTDLFILADRFDSPGLRIHNAIAFKQEAKTRKTLSGVRDPSNFRDCDESV